MTRSPRKCSSRLLKSKDKDFVIKTVMQAARSGDKGAFGDGKIFVSPG